VGEVSAESAGAPATRQALYLHIGLPKSGSTFVQSLLGGNRQALKEHGFVYPYVEQEGMFHAAVEMSGRPDYWGLSRSQIAGTFAQLLRRGRNLGGTMVLSHEIFGGASREQIEVIGQHVADLDLHVVVTVRDIGRTITAQWQEQVKNGSRQPFADYADGILSSLPEEPAGAVRGFWRGQNLGWLLQRWSTLAPPERTHVVVTPSGGAGPEVLWHRFAAAIGLPLDALDPSTVPARNESLGAPQIKFLREVNEALDDRLEQPWFSIVAKRWFAQSLLSQVSAHKPITPAPVAERLTAVTQAWIGLLESGGYQVYGDLDELLPDVPSPDARHPDVATPEEMLAGLPQTVSEMLLRSRDDRSRIRELEAAQETWEEQRVDLERRLEQASRPWWRPSRSTTRG
jgi:hypothetical protein